MSAQLVVALDVPELGRARDLVERLRPLGVTFKIGYEAYYGYGAALVDDLSAAGTPYVLDLKLHDIPNTVAAAVRAVVRPGLEIITAHALGGSEMLRAAVEAAGRVRIFAVTVLTSIGPSQFAALGLSGSPGQTVVRLAELAHDAGCAGVVCSPLEARDVKTAVGTGFGTFCPGIRPSGSARGDQQRVATPADALRSGADYIVVGRPITAAPDPAAAARAILDEMRALASKR